MNKFNKTLLFVFAVSIFSSQVFAGSTVYGLRLKVQGDQECVYDVVWGTHYPSREKCLSQSASFAHSQKFLDWDGPSTITCTPEDESGIDMGVGTHLPNCDVDTSGTDLQQPIEF